MKTSKLAENPGLLRRLRGLNLALICFALVLFLAPMVPYTMAAVSPDSATGFWDQIRQGDTGVTQIKGYESGNLINDSGIFWMEFRNKWISPGGAWALALSLVILVLAYILVGPMRMSNKPSGKTMERWNRADRVIHWYVAILFLLLAVTGLSLLYGKAVLIPMMGKNAFSGYMDLGKDLHNYLGPLFILGLLVMIVKWMKHNFFTMIDVQWFSKMGGMIGNQHAEADYINGGEKAWFWVLALFGIIVSGSGLVLDFPNYGQFRETMQTSALIHAASAILLLCGSLFHMYMGTLGVQGALEGMTSGQVDEEWAKQHHKIWYDRVKQNN